MRVLFATAEMAPLATVGGLAAASAGLVGELRRQGVEVDVVLPDYGAIVLTEQERFELPCADWVGPVSVRRGRHPQAGIVHLVAASGLAKPHPYLQPDGQGWPDNDARFLAFGQAVAALWHRQPGDVLHLNDWHTATALAVVDAATPTVLSLHNLAYQGLTGGEWLARVGPRADAFQWFDSCNPLLGGIRLADAVVAVSPSYAAEILEPAGGFGLHEELAARGSALSGILNGIDVDIWNPATDPHLLAPFHVVELSGKDVAQQDVAGRLGLTGEGPLAIAVTRLTDQKGIDLLLPLLAYVAALPMRLAVLGAGDADLAARLARAAAAAPQHVAFVDGYDESLAHRLFAAGDLLVMPSRFEPCGLTQMQALRYGTLALVTAVGGLADTVVDLDHQPDSGTGWLAAQAEPLALLDALHRASRAWRNPRQWRSAQQRGMARDWSWSGPAKEYQALYHSVGRR